MKLIKRDKENDKVQNMSLLSVLFPYIFRLVLFPPNIFGGLHDSTKLGAYGEMHPFPHPNDDASDSFFIIVALMKRHFCSFVLLLLRLLCCYRHQLSIINLVYGCMHVKVVAVNFGQARPCLIAFKIPKLYKVPYHIECFNACMKY